MCKRCFYIRNSFGQHVSCVDLVQSDGKDDFLISLWHKFNISITFRGLLTSFRGIKYLKVAECVGLTVKKRTKSRKSRHWERLCWWCTHSWAADGYLTVLTLLFSVSTWPRNQKEIEKGSLLQGHGGDMDVCTQESSVVCLHVCVFVDVEMGSSIRGVRISDSRLVVGSEDGSEAFCSRMNKTWRAGGSVSLLLWCNMENISEAIKGRKRLRYRNLWSQQVKRTIRGSSVLLNEWLSPVWMRFYHSCSKKKQIFLVLPVASCHEYTSYLPRFWISPSET